MEAVKPRSEMTREELVSFVLRNCALLCDPRNGHLRSLAAAISVHEVTLSVWIKQGYVPLPQVRVLQSKFGRKNAPTDDLCPIEFRRG